MRVVEKKIKRFFYSVLVLVLAFACQNKPIENSGISKVYEGIEFDMPQVVEPAFPDFSVSIADFGAVADGKTINTQAFADAIKHVAGKGGGKVIIPRGIWITGPIILKSNINLHAEAGALVLFSTNKDLYPLVNASFEGLNTVRCLSPIQGNGLRNVAITGSGVFDGSGEVWRMVKRSKLTGDQWKKLVASGGIVDEKGGKWYPSEGFVKGDRQSKMNVPQNLKTIKEYEEIKDFLRPVMVSIVNCKEVLLDGPVFQNSPAWCIHPLMCENLTVRNLTVRNPWYSQNGDGIDIESCKNTILTNCSFDVGDDAICIKSGKDEDGRKRAMPTENLIVKNCIVYHGHGGLTVGSEMSGGVKNMHVSACTFMGTDVGLRFKSNRGRGGVVEGIYISDIDMINIPNKAISFNLYYGGKSVSEMLPEITEETPQFKDISIKNVTCKGAAQAIYLQGLPEMNLKNILLENITMETEKGLLCIDATGVTIRNLHLKTNVFPAIALYNSKNVSVKELVLSESEKPLISVHGEETEQIHIDVHSAADVHSILEVGHEVNRNILQVNTL
ncbi:glycoside hydrolase family 28 protein [Labilibaculum euxinus]|uniref:Glycoside hydrolase family 28 protein n=1 Tax=Labilibaculum euxinus TaxID=2686357 RepID=A0A7M4D538_9BACT|nr:glycoside hydrolase family 28 protein [Labilibaculum euxinus]MUP37767.1 glycoside hydrolase family 28 protein [Labilibaculum euxinus]MVB06972.1 glycoside hydrolase family 28 protein [Labilibaculum euxinus]